MVNPLAAAIQSMMASGGMSRIGMGGGSPVGGGGLSRFSGNSGFVNSGVGGSNQLMRGGMGGGTAPDPWAVSRQLAGQQNGGMADSMGGIDPNMLMMHLMNGGSLASLMQMMQARQGAGQQGVMGPAPQMNPAAGMMSAFNRPMTR